MTQATAIHRNNDADQILALLMRQSVVTASEMKKVSDSYRQRLGDLRKKYDIKCIRGEPENSWSLVRKIPGEQLSLLGRAA